MSNINRNKFDICEKKLTGEFNIGILATLITGFTINLLPSIAVNDSNKCVCSLWNQNINQHVQNILMWFTTILLSIVAIVSALTMVYVSSLNWHGMKILNKREKDEMTIDEYREKLLKKFDKMWELQHDSRKFYRKAFVLIIPIFLFGLSLSPKIWCNNCILGIIVSILFLISTIPIISILKTLILKKIKIDV